MHTFMVLQTVPKILCVNFDRKWNGIVHLYRIHSNKHLGYLGKSFWVGAYLFQYLLQRSTKKCIISAIFRLIPNHI